MNRIHALIVRFLCFVGQHGYLQNVPSGLRFIRKECVDCGRVVRVTDGLTGARYSYAAQLADDLNCEEANIEWLFKRATPTGEKK